MKLKQTLLQLAKERHITTSFLLTFVQGTNVTRDVERQLRVYFGDLVFRSMIPKNVKLEEAAQLMDNLMFYG